MEKCSCWEPTFKTEWGDGYNRAVPIQICNGTKEREECSCNGDPAKCNFYPKKREEGKGMNTAEMWLKAQEDGKTYYCNSMKYQKDIGLVGVGTGYTWDCGSWVFLDDLMNEKWSDCQTMTKSEAEKKFNIKIVGD